MAGTLGALLLTDGRLPSGGYAYSGGLEPALGAGLAPADIPAYIRARARTVALVEASAAVLAQRSALDAPDRLARVHEALLARTPSEPLREISGFLGRGLLRMARRLWPDHPGVIALRGIDTPLRPIALGAVAAAMGMSAEALARASFYDDIQTVTSATLKLAPIDPVDTVGWLIDLEPLIEALIAQVLAIDTVTDLPALTAPSAEQWSLDHAGKTRRIFRA
ncbi:MULTISPECIES: urease accessory protein UreF [unclassified Pseudactinotalea]|uniref:urease accessory protein UreF n=1 Tax=unclassified Pseudactinotalea TaxID=2649176 RepID=UPI00128C12B4|nr:MULTISPECIES: urease accessory UreF family protein [unclassified Pseudactinotalea]MPV49695.1 urease accessory protein [Pseudactinotalea sp. HY160]QGH69631.1 urease accessory protein [Pseudactinotalea sp. HY158]